LTPLIAFRILEPVLDVEAFQNFILPVLGNLASDRIANIKMNVIKVIISYAPKLKGTDSGSKCIGYLKAMKSDTEFDVSYLAEKGLKEF